jgi:Zn-dependent peptidase ImmA (M78 family)
LKKADDCTLTAQQYVNIKVEAERVLNEANAHGVYPTPVHEIMAAANLREEKEDVLNESFVLKIRKEIGNVGKALRSAMSKVLGLFDARTGIVFIDKSLHEVKKTFIRLHETAHGFLSWQKDMYAVVEDGELNLAPDVADLFDREANVFASEVLFQLDAFANEANDHNFGIFVPINMSKKYGASIYSSIRQYVSKNPKACTVVVLDAPVMRMGDGFRANVRRSALSSPSFFRQFGDIALPEYVTPDDKIGAMVPLGKQRACGKREIILVDKNGVDHKCIAEAFTNTYQVFVLIVASQTMTSTKIFMPS